MFLLTLFIGAGLSFLQASRQNNDLVMAQGNEDLIRLHIIANSDSNKDQQIKYKVRDAVVATLKPELEKVTSNEEAKKVITLKRQDLIRIAKKIVKDNGENYPVSLESGWFDFPLRSYGSLVLPAGKYEAVRILLGNASGKNWWCVLYPPLCFIDATGAVALPASSVNCENKQKIEIRWKVSELLSAIYKN